jgi:hypothetical protein
LGDQDDAIRRSHEITPSDQDALVAQCTRCTLRDSAVWLLAGAGAGVVVGALTGADIVPALVMTVVLAGLQVLAVRRGMRALYPVGTTVTTVLTEHRLAVATGDMSLPLVTGVRHEGGVVRVDLDLDHTHLVPGAVDIDALAARAGRPAPEPVRLPGSRVVEVPPGLGGRAARRIAVRDAVRNADVLPMWGLTALCLVLGQWALAATVAVSQVGALVARARMEQRAFDRAFPPGVPLDVQWHGWTLELRSARGLSVVDVGQATAGATAGQLFVVRREGGPSLAIPDVVVTDDVRARLRG